jgi:hypothetical protein
MDNDLSEQEANNYIQDFHEMESCNDHFVFLAKQDAKVMCLIELGYEIDLFQGFILDIFISENMSGDEVFTDLLDFSESILTNRAIESIKIRFALADAIADHDYWFDSGYDFDEKEDEYAKSLV